MPEGEGKKIPRIAEKRPRIEESGFKHLFAKLRKHRIIETLAAFIGGGWLLIEVVERLLVNHYRFPKESIDLTVISVIGALLATLIWRWFGGTGKRPGNIKVEVLLVPLIILAVLSIDLMILLEILDISGKTLLIVAVAVCLGIAWIILKSLQWAAAAPASSSGLIRKSIESPSRASGPPEKSIVVLPFADLSPQKDQEYFCDGMTEEIITDLSSVHALRVISRNSAMTFRGTQKTTGTIGQELNVQYVLEGSVRKAGNDLRITAQLIDAKSDAHLWAEKYSGTLDDVFDLQERLSRRIVDALKVTLTTDEERRLASRPISDSRAYDAYLRARREWSTFTKEGIERGLHLANEALTIVGDNALIYAALGQIYYASYDFGISHDEETLRKAETNALKALDLNPVESQALFSIGLVRYKRGDFQGSIRYSKRATELERDGVALGMLTFILTMVGRTTEARRYADEARMLDPLTFWTAAAPGIVDLFEGRFDAAIVRMRDSMNRASQGEPFPLWWLAQAYAYAGQDAEAQGLFEQIAKMPGAGFFSDTAELFSRSLSGNRKGVLDWLSTNVYFREMAKTDEYFPLFLANGLANVGETKEALDWIEQAIAWGFSNHRFLSQHNRFLAPLRGDPRFEALMERAREKERRFEI